MESASECNIGQGKKSSLVTSESTLSTAILKTWSQLVQLGVRLHHGCNVAVQKLNEELTVLHSIKLVQATLQRAGALPGALLHTVHSMRLITC